MKRYSVNFSIPNYMFFNLSSNNVKRLERKFIRKIKKCWNFLEALPEGVEAITTFEDKDKDRKNIVTVIKKPNNEWE